MSKSHVKVKDKPNVESYWDQMIEEARQRIRDFKESIRVFEAAKKRGEPSPFAQLSDQTKESATQC
jgi:hypothetical protein